MKWPFFWILGIGLLASACSPPPEAPTPPVVPTSPAPSAPTAPVLPRFADSIDEFENYAAGEVQSWAGPVFVTQVGGMDAPVWASPLGAAPPVAELAAASLIVVTGTSASPIEKEGRQGLMHRVTRYRDRHKEDIHLGWVFAADLAPPPEIEPAPVQVLLALTQAEGTLSDLALKIGEERRPASQPILPGQPFFAFVVDKAQLSQFHYSWVPGTYVFSPETDTVRHVSYFSGGVESAWTLVSSDLRLLLEDQGTAPGLRGLRLREALSGTVVQQAWYLRDLDYTDGQITLAERARDSEEARARIAAALAERPLSDEEEAVVFYRYNLSTGQKTFLRVEGIRQP